MIFNYVVCIVTFRKFEPFSAAYLCRFFKSFSHRCISHVTVGGCRFVKVVMIHVGSNLELPPLLTAAPKSRIIMMSTSKQGNSTQCLKISQKSHFATLQRAKLMLELEMLEKHKNLKKLERLYKVFQKKFKQQILGPD